MAGEGKPLSTGWVLLIVVVAAAIGSVVAVLAQHALFGGENAAVGGAVGAVVGAGVGALARGGGSSAKSGA